MRQALALILLLLIPGILGAQAVRPAPAQVVKYTVGRDSLDVFRALPDAKSPRPAVIVLPDRFGMGTYLRSLLGIIASQGFRAYALPLKSAPTRRATGEPEVVLDSGDIDRLSQLVADIVDEKGCDGRAMLLGIDAGAHVGIVAASRMPLFKAIVLVSPIVDNEFIDALTKIEVPSFVAFGAEDEHGNSTSLSLLREEMFDRGRRFNAVAYKNAHRYFFNALHPQYDRKAMNAVLNEALRLFHSVL